jgi:mRNA-degrading endonuclease YafQ of YafQ-DinJ toxin-antitoxin module
MVYSDMSRVVLVTSRFKKDFSVFVQKYPHIISVMNDFLKFRNHARSDEPFSSKDSPMTTANGFRRLHLVMGKAILIYSLANNQIKLAAIVEHNAVEHGRMLHQMAKWLESLSDEDYQPIKPEKIVGLSSEQIKDIRAEIYTMAVNPSERPALTNVVAGDFSDFLINAQFASADESLTVSGLLNAFGGEDNFKKDVLTILKNTHMQEANVW